MIFPEIPARVGVFLLVFKFRLQPDKSLDSGRVFFPPKALWTFDLTESSRLEKAPLNLEPDTQESKEG